MPNDIYEDLPSSLAMLLAHDTKALMAYAALTNQEKTAFVAQARRVNSKADMKRLVSAMAESGNPMT